MGFIPIIAYDSWAAQWYIETGIPAAYYRPSRVSGNPGGGNQSGFNGNGAGRCKTRPGFL